MTKLDIKNHPCFNAEVCAVKERAHLPVAKDCNIQCNFCNRKYACVNENRPGVTSVILTPEQSVRYLEKVLSRRPNISVVGIAGPGEAFAQPHITLKTLRLIRERFPEMLLCVASNGLNILAYLDELSRLEVSHVTITVNAVKAQVGAGIYSWVRYEKRMYRGIEAAALLIDKQLEAIKRLKQKDIIVKVNTIIIPGINDGHITEIAKKVSELGVDILNCIPLCPSKDTVFELVEEPDDRWVGEIRKQAEQYLPQMHHCRRCRADAAGLLGEGLTDESISCLVECSRLPVDAKENGSCIAIASREGVLINQHLGEAEELLVYKRIENGFELLGKRKTPEPGKGVKRWLELADVLADCWAILVSGAGDTPREILNIKGIRVIETEGIIEDILNRISSGTKIDNLEKKTGCNFGCSGAGRGCG